MGLRRGFKKEANETAQEIRNELDLEEHDPFDAFKLAELLSIPVLKLSDVEPGSILLSAESHSFSAVTVFRGKSRVIVHNDSHAIVRQKSNISHELSHALLLHPPTPALDDKGCREWNQEIEDEAFWLASVLMVSEAATLHIASRIASGHLNKDDAAETLGVSKSLLQQRLNATGAFKRVERRKLYMYRNQISM